MGQTPGQGRSLKRHDTGQRLASWQHPNSGDADGSSHDVLQPSDFDFEMVHGMTRVWADASRDTIVADTPGDSYEFFVDMHRLVSFG